MKINFSNWDLLKELEKRYGNSFYVLYTLKFKRNYLDFLSAFKSIYKNTYIEYSYKTKYIPTLSKIVNTLGGYAEVVSQMEYDIASRHEVSPNRIISNGPLRKGN